MLIEAASARFHEALTQESLQVQRVFLGFLLLYTLQEAGFAPNHEIAP